MVKGISSLDMEIYPLWKLNLDQVVKRGVRESRENLGDGRLKGEIAKKSLTEPVGTDTFSI